MLLAAFGVSSRCPAELSSALDAADDAVTLAYAAAAGQRSAASPAGSPTNSGAVTPGGGWNAVVHERVTLANLLSASKRLASPVLRQCFGDAPRCVVEKVFHCHTVMEGKRARRQSATGTTTPPHSSPRDHLSQSEKKAQHEAVKLYKKEHPGATQEKLIRAAALHGIQAWRSRVDDSKPHPHSTLGRRSASSPSMTRWS